jgi:hypothetical protein
MQREWRIERGVYTPMAMERVRKRLKIKGLRRSIAQKSAETIGSKGVECIDRLRGSKGVEGRCADKGVPSFFSALKTKGL